MQLVKRVLFATVVVLAAVVPWSWFTALTFILKPVAMGSLAEGYGAIGFERALQASCFAAVGLLIVTGFTWLSLVRLAAGGRWLFGRYSIGRLLKWASCCVLVSFAVTQVPAAAISADAGAAYIAADPGVSWATGSWLLLLSGAVLVAITTITIDVIVGLVRSSRPSDGGSNR